MAGKGQTFYRYRKGKCPTGKRSRKCVRKAVCNEGREAAESVRGEVQSKLQRSATTGGDPKGRIAKGARPRRRAK